MIKTTNNSSIQISKLAFLDEMLPEPYFDEQRDDSGEIVGFYLKNTEKLLDLVKKLAAKTFSEQELIDILGDESKDCMWNRATYKIK